MSIGIAVRNSAPEGVNVGVERTSGDLSFVDVLDRVLDKGIVIDGWMRVSLMGMDLVTVEGRVVVASLSTYMKHSTAFSQARPTSQLVSRKRNKSAEKDQHSPPWLYELLEGFPDGP